MNRYYFYIVLQLVFFLTFILFLFGVVQPPWQKNSTKAFISHDFKVSIIFPTAFEKNITEKKDSRENLIEEIIITAKEKEDLYMLKVTKHPRLVARASAYLISDVVEKFVSLLDGRIIEEKGYRQKTSEGRDVLIYLSEQKKYAHYRIILFDRFQYQVIVVDNSNELLRNGHSFMDSFTIL